MQSRCNIASVRHYVSVNIFLLSSGNSISSFGALLQIYVYSLLDNYPGISIRGYGLTAFLQDYPHQHSNRFVFWTTTRRIESVVLLSRSQIIYHFTAIYIDRSQIHISERSRRYSKDVKHLCID